MRLTPRRITIAKRLNRQFNLIALIQQNLQPVLIFSRFLTDYEPFSIALSLRSTITRLIKHVL